MSGDDGYRRDLKGNSRRGYREANPDAFGKVDGDIPSIQRLGTIGTRARDIKDKLREHLSRHEDRWVSREALKLLEYRATLASKYPKPAGVVPEGLSPQALVSEARRRVRARATQRLTRVNEAAARMRNAIVKSQPEPKKEPGPKHKHRRTLKLNWDQLP